MSFLANIRRPMAIALLAVMTTASLAPLAEAGRKEKNGHGRSKKSDRQVESRSSGRREAGILRSRSGESKRSVRRDVEIRRPAYRDVEVRRRTTYRDVEVRRRPVYRDVEVYRPSYRSSVRVHRRPSASYTVWRRSSHGPVIAGFLGGLFLGATIANAAPHGYAYWDPYCHQHFGTLELYYSHCSHHRHEHTIQVIEVPAGYGHSDYHYCDECEDEYWGDEHDCG